MKPLDGQVALVTGAGRGIGAAIAMRLARGGASVVVNDLDEQPAIDVARQIESDGGRSHALAGNVVDPSFGERAVAACIDRYGSLDIVVNNAGYTWDGMLHRMSDEQWQAMLDVHLTGPFRLLRAAYPVFRSQREHDAGEGRTRHRRVVNISSVVGLGGNIGQLNYATAKAGVVGLTKSLAKEWGRWLVNVNCVAFGHIDTRLTRPRGRADDDVPTTIDIDGRAIPVGVGAELAETMARTIPLGRGGTVEEAAGAVYLLCLPESDYVSGQVIVCGGGFTLG